MLLSRYMMEMFCSRRTGDIAEIMDQFSPRILVKRLVFLRPPALARVADPQLRWDTCKAKIAHMPVFSFKGNGCIACVELEEGHDAWI